MKCIERNKLARIVTDNGEWSSLTDVSKVFTHLQKNITLLNNDILKYCSRCCYAVKLKNPSKQDFNLEKEEKKHNYIN